MPKRPIKGRLPHQGNAAKPSRVDMKAEKRQLAVIGLIAAICACAALTFDSKFFTVVFVLESAVANMLAFL
jgi:hypothetical protein